MNKKWEWEWKRNRQQYRKWYILACEQNWREKKKTRGKCPEQKKGRKNKHTQNRWTERQHLLSKYAVCSLLTVHVHWIVKTKWDPKLQKLKTQWEKKLNKEKKNERHRMKKNEFCETFGLDFAAITSYYILG